MITIASVLKSGGDYNVSHVSALEASVKKHLSVEHSFVCLTDMDYSGNRIQLEHGWPGWWSKIELFKISGPVIYFDLDTIIINNFDNVVENALASKFCILRDVYIGRKDPYSMQSSVMSWNGDMKKLYDTFAQSPDRYMKSHRGDQDYIYSELGKSGTMYFQDVLPNTIVSYKAHVKGKTILPETKIVIFHGLPRPWQQTQIPYDNIKK